MIRRNNRLKATFLSLVLVALVSLSGTLGWSTVELNFTDTFPISDGMGGMITAQPGILAYDAETSAIYGFGIIFTDVSISGGSLVDGPYTCFGCLLNFSVSVAPLTAPPDLFNGFEFLPGGAVDSIELTGEIFGIAGPGVLVENGSFSGGLINDDVNFSGSGGADFKSDELVNALFGAGTQPPNVNFGFSLTTVNTRGPFGGPVPAGAPTPPGGFPGNAAYEQFYTFSGADFTNTAPEPGTIVLLTLGLVGLAARRRN